MKEIIFFVSAFIVTAILLWLAWQRTNRQRLFWRVLASIGAILSLVLMALPPTQTVRVTATEAILLTPGYQQDSLQKIQKQRRGQPPIISYANHVAGYQSVTSLSQLIQDFPLVKRLHVLGYGLEASELKQANSLQIIPHLSAWPAGVVSLDWQKRLTAGEKLMVTGRFHQPVATNSWLYLSLANQALDSVQVKNTGTSRFSLSYFPKQAGRYIYHLHTKRDKQRAFVGELPVEVKPKQKLRVLLLPAGPSFEAKFLKNYLAEEQHGVAVRIPVSKDIYQTEWLNLRQMPLNQINTKLLQSFDIVITEGSVIAALTQPEQKALIQTVQTDGLGIVVVTDALPGASALFKGFQFKNSSLSASTLNQISVNWADQAKPEKTITLPYTLRQTPDLKKLVWHESQNTLVGVKRFGWGKVTVSLLPQTYAWLLGGNKPTYAAYWSLLLGQTSKPQLTDHTWHVPISPLPSVNQPLTLHLANYAPNNVQTIPRGVVQTQNQQPDSVYLAQDFFLRHRFTGNYWPRVTGWLQVNKLNGAAHFFYVFPDSSFNTWRMVNRLHATLNYAQKNINKPAPANYIIQRKPIPAIYFFLSFLICAGFLWIEEKW